MLSKIRNNAKNIFSQHGYPSIKDENWKYTSTENFQNCNVNLSKNIDYDINKINLPDDMYNIVICNGKLIYHDDPLDGLQIKNYNDITKSSKSENFLQICDPNNSVAAHNTSEFSDAVYIDFEKEFQLEKAINIISITSNLTSDEIVFPRVYIHAKENSNVKIYIENLADKSNCAINSVFEFYCEDSSRIEVIQSSSLDNQEVIESFFFNQKNKSTIQFLSMSFGGKLYRSNIDISINGEHCDNHFGVLILGENQQHIDYHADIKHLTGNSSNTFLCRSLLKDQSKGIFNGKILIEDGASGSDSQLNNNNILLSENAEMQSNPQLEINCEDVKCSHGSTMGSLSENELFYLTSRGIDKDFAKSMLIEGFINKLLIPFELDSLNINERIKSWI